MKKILLFLMLAFCMTTNGQTRKTFKITKKYLNIPIQSSAEKQQVVFKLDGEYLTQNDIHIAEYAIEYWTFLDVTPFNGRELTLEIPIPYSGADKIYQSDSIVGEKNLYKEKLRPQVHYTTKRGWNNDPNGMVYYNGEYHLFYQYNPYENKWGNMHWGHAVSKDLLHWKELPAALMPDKLGTIYSGSAVIDYKNTSGFGTKKNPAMVAIYTADNGGRDGSRKQQQCVAYSLDKGRTFTKYEGNPVIPANKRFGSEHERDPKVFWYQPGNHWVMILHEGIHYCIYNSSDLKSWKYMSSLEDYFWECPELFELAVDGNDSNKKWVVFNVRGNYQIGNFDGKKFTAETEMQYYNFSSYDMTAAQTFNDEPNGRRIQIGWAHAEFQGMPFRSSFTVPMELSLRTTPGGVKLHVLPVKEIESLHTKKYSYTNIYIGNELNEKLKEIKNPSLHIKTTIQAINTVRFGLNINGNKIIYDISRSGFYGQHMPLQNGLLKMEIIVDKNMIEVFVDGGRYYWFENYKQGNLSNFKLSFIPGGNNKNANPKTLVKNLEIYELKSIWN